MKEPLDNFENAWLFAIFGGVFVPLFLLCGFGIVRALQKGKTDAVILLCILLFGAICIAIGLGLDSRRKNRRKT